MHTLILTDISVQEIIEALRLSVENSICEYTFAEDVIENIMKQIKKEKEE